MGANILNPDAARQAEQGWAAYGGREQGKIDTRGQEEAPGSDEETRSDFGGRLGETPKV